MTKFDRYARWAVLPLLVILPLSAQKKDQGISKQQADEILNELRQIRQLLEKQEAVLAAGNRPQGPARATLDLTGTQMLGDKNAPLTIVEFTDYQCPFCQ